MKTNTLLLFTILLAAGCGGSSGGSGTRDTFRILPIEGYAACEAYQTAPNPPSINFSINLNADSRIGQSGKTIFNIDASGSSLIEGRYEVQTFTYNDINCGGDVEIASSMTGNVTKTGTTTEGYDKVDMSVERALVIIHSTEIIASLNQRNFCNRTWTAGEVVDLFALNCSAFDVARNYYDIALVTANTLQIGKTTGTLDGKTPETRPVALDSTIYRK